MLPKTDREEPNRDNILREKLDPIEKVSSTLNCDPQKLIPKTDNEDPRRLNPRIEKLEPR
jgi:hypothetical protein